MDGQEGTRQTDLKKLVRIMKAGGYRGYIPIETLGRNQRNDEPRTRVLELLRELRRALNEVD